MVLFLASSCAAAFGLTLGESIDLAINNSPRVSISKSNIKYNEYVKDEAAASYHPTLEAGYSWQKLQNPTAFTFSPSYNYNLSLKYNLFNGFSDYSTISSKESELASAKLEDKAVLADLKLAVAVVYANYLKVKKSIDSFARQLASLTKQYDDTKARYEQGVVAKNDLLLIEVEKLRAEQALVKSKSDFVIARSDLENAIATTIAQDETIEDFDASVGELEELSVLEERMMTNRSEIKAMRFKSESLLSQRDALSGNYLPKVNLEASYQVNDKERLSGSSIFQPKDQTSYGLNATWNLYSGFRNLALKKALLEKNSQQNFQLAQLRLDLKNQLVKAYEGFKVAKSAKSVASRAKESATENYRITSDRYGYGDVDALTVLVSQSSLTQALNKDNDAHYDLYLAYKTLQRIVLE